MTYAIRITRQYFGPKTVKSYVTDGFAPLVNGEEQRAEFRTRAEAESLVGQLNDATYHTAHNESGRPEYKVVRL